MTVGIDWQGNFIAVGGTNYYPFDIAYGNGIYVITASSDDSNAYTLTSSDGATWTVNTLSGIDNLSLIFFGGGKFIARTNTGQASSTNGVAWTNLTLPITVDPMEGESFGAGTYGEGKYVIPFLTPHIALTSTPKAIISSDGGTTWTTIDSPLIDDGYGQSFYYDGNFILSQPDYSPDYTILFISADGSTWARHDILAGIRDIAFNGTTYALLVRYDDSGIEKRRVYRTTNLLSDSGTWAYTQLSNDDSWTNIVYNHSQFTLIGAGTNLVATSTDAVTWTVRYSLEGGGQIRELTYSGSAFVGVGYNFETGIIYNSGIARTPDWIDIGDPPDEGDGTSEPSIEGATVLNIWVKDVDNVWKIATAKVHP
jgi:hypothetical protein